jgi:hypothetical protein
MFKRLIRKPLFWVVCVALLAVAFVAIEENPNALQALSAYSIF